MGVSPATLDINGSVGQKACSLVKITSDRMTEVSLFILWDQNQSYSAVEFTPFTISLNRTIYTSVCFTAQERGTYTGAIVLQDQRNLIHVNLPLTFKAEERLLSRITGQAIYELGPQDTTSFLIGMSIIEFLLLTYLVIKLIRKV